MLKWFISSQVETARRARGAVVMALGLALFFGAFAWAALEILAGPDVGGGDGMRTFTIPTSAASADAFTARPSQSETGDGAGTGATGATGAGAVSE